ncbi:MAG: NERD domain-containing protein [Solirubrobacterales bacterium]|nr:NERD domain-containing protein [Solirubrobacterales bacterium]
MDHVLVGPAGIFTIETKSHHGRLRANALDSQVLKPAYAEAKSVERSPGSGPCRCSCSAAQT